MPQLEMHSTNDSGRDLSISWVLLKAFAWSSLHFQPIERWMMCSLHLLEQVLEGGVFLEFGTYESAPSDHDTPSVGHGACSFEWHSVRQVTNCVGCRILGQAALVSSWLLPVQFWRRTLSNCKQSVQRSLPNSVIHLFQPTLHSLHHTHTSHHWIQLHKMPFRHQPVTKPIRTKYDKLKVDILRGLLALRVLPTTGKKADLTMRLFQDDNNNERLAALRALWQQPAVVKPSSDPDPGQGPSLCYPRQNHTSYYESISIAQLVYHLHEPVLSVHGDQEDLVKRLRDYDWDGSDSGYSESDDEEEEDHTASFYHRTLTHQSLYDGKGLHPSILIGLRIQGFFYDAKKGLQLHCDRGCFNLTFCGWPWPTSVGLPLCHTDRIRLDKVLWNGLRSVQQLDE